jgi:hypothetical protein
VTTRTTENRPDSLLFVRFSFLCKEPPAAYRPLQRKLLDHSRPTWEA